MDVSADSLRPNRPKFAYTVIARYSISWLVDMDFLRSLSGVYTRGLPDEEVELSDKELNRPDPIGVSRDRTLDKLLKAAEGHSDGYEVTSYQGVDIAEDMNELVSSLYQMFVHSDYLPHRNGDPQDLVIPHRYDEKILRECVLSKYSQTERPGIESAVVLVRTSDAAGSEGSERNAFQRAKELFRHFKSPASMTTVRESDGHLMSIFSQRIIYTRSLAEGRQMGVWWASVDPETGMDKYEFRVGPPSGRLVPVDPEDDSVELRPWILRLLEKVQ